VLARRNIREASVNSPRSYELWIVVQIINGITAGVLTSPMLDEAIVAETGRVS
jgi:hypothetical protein